MPDQVALDELCRSAVEAAAGGEAIEAFAQESRSREAEARKGEIEGLSSAESRGVGVRLIAGEGRLGYAYAADPSVEEVRRAVAQARENAALGSPDPENVLPAAGPIAEMPTIYRSAQAEMPIDRLVRLALDLEARTVSIDPRVTKVEACEAGDSVSRIAIASTEGLAASYERTDTWCVAVTLAEEGDDVQTGYSYRLGRELDELGWEEVAFEAATRAARMLGAEKPPSAKVPVVLDPFAASSFLGVLSGALSAESVQKGRSLFADKMGTGVGSEHVTLVDDGTLLDGPAAAPFDDEGVPNDRTELIAGGELTAFLHNTYTARRGDTASTGNASRAGYRSSPGVGTSNFFLEPGEHDLASLLARAEGGVLVQQVTGVHSGANPISGTFSVGATGLRIREGAVEEGLREMTIASTIPEMLSGITAVGSDLRFFSSVGTPSILIGEMTLGGR
ncbi:MAG: TldD/PmbA family protein [Actinomycetota bacterium]